MIQRGQRRQRRGKHPTFGGVARFPFCRGRYENPALDMHCCALPGAAFLVTAEFRHCHAQVLSLVELAGTAHHRGVHRVRHRCGRGTPRRRVPKRAPIAPVEPIAARATHARRRTAGGLAAAAFGPGNHSRIGSWIRESGATCGPGVTVRLRALQPPQDLRVLRSTRDKRTLCGKQTTLSAYGF